MPSKNYFVGSKSDIQKLAIEVDKVMGYPKPGRNALTGEIVPNVVTTNHAQIVDHPTDPTKAYYPDNLGPNPKIEAIVKRMPGVAKVTIERPVTKKLPESEKKKKP